MFGLRQKLLLGFGGLVAILLVVSGLGVAVLTQYRGALDKFFYENWRSVEYAQKMVDALEKLNDTAKTISQDASTPQINSAVASARPALEEFDTNVDAENHNITLEGEDKIAEALTLLWNGQNLAGQKINNENYRDSYAKLLDEHTTGPVRAQAYDDITSLSPQVKTQAQKVIRLNLDNMRPIDGRAKKMADNATRLMVLLAVVGVALAVIYTLIVGRSILLPITTVTKSIREIEQGNLDLVVQVKSHDELRQLAEAFNSMAEKLREFRRSDRAKLIRTQRTTQLAVNSLPDAIAIINPEGKIELSNQTAQRLFQLHPERSISEISEHRLNEIYRQVAQEQRPLQSRGYESAIEVYDQSGQLKFFLPHALPIMDGAEHLLGVTLVLADVTNLRRLDEMKSGLLSVVSHELKTPLTSIRMAAHLLLEERVGPLNPQQTELLVAAREDSDRLQGIIEDLLDMGRLESGRVKLDLHAKSPQRLVTDAVTPLEAAFHDRGIHLDVDVPPELPNVMADPARIDHVFSNLLTNALKFTQPGGRVRVHADADKDGMVQFFVEDSGIGIEKEFLDRVFDRFFRVPRENQPAGAGLGLAIAKDIVQAHGGKIWAESDGTNRGAKFIFTLHSEQHDRPKGDESEVQHEHSVHSGNGR